MGTKQYNDKTGGRGIEWCDETRNAIGGCMHECAWVMPNGEKAICYAKEVAESGPAQAAYQHGFAHHYWRETAFKQLVTGNEPLLIFCDSMSDMFAANVPDDQVRRVLNKMREAPHHVYQCLTKAAPQLLKYTDDMPPNLWVGVSSPPDWFMGKRLSQKQQEAMLGKSLEVLAEVRNRTGNIVWMSAEPVSWELCGTDLLGLDHPLDWIVIGAASSGKKYFQPLAEHVVNLLDLMDATATPVFFKGNIARLVSSFAKTSQHARWREDFPLAYRTGEVIPAVNRRQVLANKLGWTLTLTYKPKPLDAYLDGILAHKPTGELF